MPRPRPTRRVVLRLLAAAPAALVPALAPQATGAKRIWCRQDPVVRVDGQTAHVLVGVAVRNMGEARRLATGPTRVVVEAPPGVAAECLASGVGFGYPFEVEVRAACDLVAAEAEVPVRVTVLVPTEPTDEDVQVVAEFAPSGQGRLRPGQGSGYANHELRFTAPEPDEPPADPGGGGGGGRPGKGHGRGHR